MSNQISIEDREARLMQMQINTRLTALQSALELMKIPAYSTTPDVSGCHQKANTVDYVTLLAIASDVEKYILDGLEQQAKDAIDAARKGPSKILQVRP